MLYHHTMARRSIICFLPTAFSLRRGVEMRDNTSQNNVTKMTVQCSFIHSTDYGITNSQAYSNFQEHCLIISSTTQTFHHIYPKGLGIMMFTATFNNISTISNHRTATGHWQTLSRNVVSSTPHNIRGHMNFS
jgi:hypothetical protein